MAEMKWISLESRKEGREFETLKGADSPIDLEIENKMATDKMIISDEQWCPSTLGHIGTTPLRHIRLVGPQK